MKHQPRAVLVTGGAGFIGCNFVRYMLDSDPDVLVVVLDALTYAGHQVNLSGLDEDRCKFIRGDIRNTIQLGALFEVYQLDTVVHLAAESHVDRSISGPMEFVQTNVEGTAILLEEARRFWGDRTDVRFHHVSTDEVFGSVEAPDEFTESTPYDPSSPYSASKAASDHLVRAWHRTYGLPVTISNCSNNYGPYQHPEKLVPLMIRRGLDLCRMPVYGDGQNVRDWLHVEDHCSAIDAILRNGTSGETYNVGGRNALTNTAVVAMLCSGLDEVHPNDAPHSRLIEMVTDRPGHDRRYAIDPSKIETELDWRARHEFGAGIRNTIRWYVDHPGWIKTVTA